MTTELKNKALKLLSQGKITLSKGAEIAKMSIWDFIELVKISNTIYIKERELIERYIL